MKKLNELFSVNYGNKFDLNKMRRLSPLRGGVNFVGRSSQNNGVSGTVSPLPGKPPYEAGLITVALGGTKLLSSFVQEQPFYTAQNVAVLKPKKKMRFAEKLYVCICIRHNRFRYSAFGREANRTLRTILIPEPKEFPSWIKGQKPDTIAMFARPATPNNIPLSSATEWGRFTLKKLFSIKKGKRLTKANMSPGEIPFIGAVDKNNGVSAWVGQSLHRKGTITVTYNGSVAEAFYQPRDFWASDDVNVLYPRFPMTPEIALFLVTIIRREKYRFNYGRKWHLERMNESVIRLPIASDNNPDWPYIQKYIESLPYSSKIC